MENTFNEKQARSDFQKVVSASWIGKIQGFFAIIGLLGIIGFFVAFILWFWMGWGIGWRVGLTSVVTVCMVTFLQSSFKKGIKESEDKYIEKLENNVDTSYTPAGIKKSKFQQRLEELYEERKRQKNW